MSQRVGRHPDYSALGSIGGQGSGQASIDVCAPWTGQQIGSVHEYLADDVTEVVDDVRRFQPTWRRTPFSQRAQIARRFARLLLSHQTELLDLVQWETGKNRASAYEELLDSAMVSTYYTRNAQRFLRSTTRRGALPGLTKVTEYRHPKGVVGIITPWNYPLDLPVSGAIPALLAGNCVVLKPDSLTPLTALKVLELLRRAELPRNAMRIVTGPGQSLGTALIESVDYVMFTGSTTTGRTVASQAGDNLIGCSAELGGKNPMVVLADADIPSAARNAVHASFANTGQLCISIERIYVERSVYDRFTSELLAAINAMTIGPGTSWGIDMGSLISERQLETVTQHVDDARTHGAQILHGGKPLPELGPYFYEPTVLADVPDAALASRAETFGPVVSVYPVASAEEAIARANDSDYGLNASIWSRNHGPSIARALQTGTVNINDGYAAAWASHDASMGGFGVSGLGRRHSADGLLKYTESQTVADQRLMPVEAPRWIPGGLFSKVASAGVRGMSYLPRKRSSGRH